MVVNMRCCWPLGGPQTPMWSLLDLCSRGWEWWAGVQLINSWTDCHRQCWYLFPGVGPLWIFRGNTFPFLISCSRINIRRRSSFGAGGSRHWCGYDFRSGCAFKIWSWMVQIMRLIGSYFILKPNTVIVLLNYWASIIRMTFPCQNIIAFIIFVLWEDFPLIFCTFILICRIAVSFHKWDTGRNRSSGHYFLVCDTCVSLALRGVTALIFMVLVCLIRHPNFLICISFSKIWV